MRFSKVVVEFNCFTCSSAGARQIFLRSSCAVNGNQRASVSYACVSEGIAQVFLSRLLEIGERFLKVLSGAPVPKIAPFEIKLMRFRILSRLRRDGLLLGTA